MKTTQQALALGLVLFSAGAVNAQPPSAPAAGPMPSTQSSPPGQMPATNSPGATSAPPSMSPAQATEPMPPLPSSAPQMYEPPQPIDYAGMARTPRTYQGNFMVGLGWDVGIPVGSAHNFTENVSAAGFELYFQYWLTGNLTVGAAMDWQTYWDSKPRATYGIENGAITATADNSIQNGAARFLTRWYFLDQGPVMPYAGLNIGVGWTTFQSTAASLVLYDNTVSVLLGGEVGVAIAAARSAPLFTVSARYSTLPAADFLAVTNVQAITFQLGMLSP